MEINSDQASVYIVEDAAAIRERISALLSESSSGQIVGESDNPSTAIREILRIRPHSVILDIHLNGGSGLEVIKAVHPIDPEIVFIVLTNYPNAQYQEKFLACGASYFLDKNSDFPKLPDAVRESLH